MRTSIHVMAVLFLSAAAASLAQQKSDGPPAPNPAPKIGMGSKTMASCARDTTRYCSTAPTAVVKECLVKHWDRIGNDCQNALGTPIVRGRAGD